MLRKIRKFTKLSSEEKKLFLEAYLMLGIMRASILSISFKRLTHLLEHLPNKEEITVLNKEENAKAIAVGKAITRAAVYTPWESACLAQALTAQKMLQKRGIPGVFYLGAAKDVENKGNMKAHAWSQCGETIITGAGGHEDFTILSVFGWGNE